MARIHLLTAFTLATSVSSFTASQPKRSPAARIHSQSQCNNPLFSSPDGNDIDMAEKFGGFTTKQRLREEVESPFRKVRLAFFSFSGASALVAFYFSALVSSNLPTNHCSFWVDSNKMLLD
jgi:hypothetical protein